MCHFVSYIMYFQKLIMCKTPPGGRGYIASSRSTNRTLYRGAGIYIMDGYDFYHEAKTKIYVFLQEQRQITLLHQFLCPFLASGETSSQRTVTLEERCSFAFQ